MKRSVKTKSIEMKSCLGRVCTGTALIVVLALPAHALQCPEGPFDALHSKGFKEVKRYVETDKQLFAGKKTKGGGTRRLHGVRTPTFGRDCLLAGKRRIPRATGGDTPPRTESPSEKREYPTKSKKKRKIPRNTGSGQQT